MGLDLIPYWLLRILLMHQETMDKEFKAYLINKFRFLSCGQVLEEEDLVVIDGQMFYG